MKYEVRYLIDGEEHTDAVEAESAASAAHQMQDQFVTAPESFELIQVQLMDDPAESEPAASTGETH
jgi:hypothetical protein